MRSRFDKQLDLLSSQLTYMGSLCEKAIANVARALENGDLQLAEQVIKEDEEIDQMEKEIESLCLKLLLQQQPVAKDLRQISAALKMITDMERIGDQTADIADIVLAAGKSEVSDIGLTLEMAEATSNMVHNSVLAYVNRDLNLACQVMESDDRVDELFDLMKQRLVQIIADNHGNQGEKAIDIMMITKYLERIGDHATNIAEWVEFSITGVHRTNMSESNSL